MFQMFKSKKFDYKKCLSKIILNRNDLRKLQKTWTHDRSTFTQSFNVL